MAATFNKNKSEIQAVLERNLAVIVPKFHSVGLISDEERDLALDTSVSSSTRAAVLINTIESKIVNHRYWWILVYVLLSSELDAKRSFFESLVVTPEPTESFTGIHEPQSAAGYLSTLEESATSIPLKQEECFSDSSVERTVMKKRSGEESGSTRPPPSQLPESVSSSKGKATGASPNAPSGATELSESEHLLTQEESAATYTPVVKGDTQSSVWYTHAKKYPRIKFSNYYTRQTVTYRGDIIKGEGIEIQIPGHAIKRGQSVEFTIQGCIDGPFELPEDVSLASPVFVITPHYQFQKEVTLWEDVYVYLQSYEDCKEVVFLTSPSEPTIDDDGPHWNFQMSENMPKCILRNRRVWIDVKQFCLFCFGIRRRVPQYQYRISLYSPLSSVNDMCRAVFSVSLYHEVFIKNLKVYLESFHHGFYETCNTPQYLTQTEIEVCLPEAIKTDGYEVAADRRPCIILKHDVDIPCRSWRHKRRAKRDIGGYPPRIILTVTYTKSLQRAMVCQLKILGVTEKLEAFNMIIPPSYKAGHDTTSSLVKRNICRGNPYNDLTMGKLLHLPLSEKVTFVNIPHEIRNHSHKLRDVLNGRDPLFYHSIYSMYFGSNEGATNFLRCPVFCIHAHDAESILRQWISIDHFVIGWESLAHALNIIGIGNRDLVHSVRSYNGPLTMTALLNFPVTKVTSTSNIPHEVGVKYFSFGTHLLQDVTGAHLFTLEHELNRNGELINQRILQEWLSGKGRPVTWATLVEVLNIIGMGELAKKIEDMYVTSEAAAL